MPRSDRMLADVVGHKFCLLIALTLLSYFGAGVNSANTGEEYPLADEIQYDSTNGEENESVDVQPYDLLQLLGGNAEAGSNFDDGLQKRMMGGDRMNHMFRDRRGFGNDRMNHMFRDRKSFGTNRMNHMFRDRKSFGTDRMSHMFRDRRGFGNDRMNHMFRDRKAAFGSDRMSHMFRDRRS